MEKRMWRNHMDSLIHGDPNYNKIDPEYYDRKAKRYGGESLAAVIYTVLQNCFPLEELKNLRVLDVATGTGLIAIFLKRQGLTVEATDLSETMLAFLHKQDPSIPIKKGDMNTSLPFPSESFDIVVTHWANRFVKGDALVKEAYRLLRPGGVFVWPFDEAESEIWKMQAGSQQPTHPEEYVASMERLGYCTEIVTIKPPYRYRHSNIIFPSKILVAKKPRT